MSSEGSPSTWRGVPLAEIYGSSSPWGAPEFSLVVPGYYHTVLYHIPGNSEFPADRPPKPRVGHDKWDHDHVRMPCSSRSMYAVENSNGETHLKKRWDIIEDALSKPIRNSRELADAILSYNNKFKNYWSFKALHKLFDEFLEEEETQYFFDVTLPQIAKLALNLPKLIQASIPLLRQSRNHSVSLSQQQISSLLANAFFCTFPRRNSTKRTSEYASFPSINFNRLYESSGSDHVLEKLKCICHYFRRVTTKVPCGVVSFSRRYVPSARLPVWRGAAHRLAHLPLHVDTAGTIEDAHGLIQVDFANKYLGGGVLNYGCVQEEIRFVICPELMITMLFTEVMTSNEAVMIIGCERYSNYTGYGNTFQWSGDHVDTCPTDSSHRRRTAVLAIDATPHYNTNNDQYTEKAILRDLNKAWIGFSFYTSDPSSLQYPGVATGNWGCGAFCGAPQLKSLLQLMACTVAGRPLAYYTFGDDRIRDDLTAIWNLLATHNVTVGQLFSYIVRFSKTEGANSRSAHENFHPFLRQLITGDDGRRKDTRPTEEPISINDSPDKDILMEPQELLSSSEFITSEVQRAFQTPFESEHSNTQQKQSPDIFSQGDDECLTEIKVHNDKEATSSKDQISSNISKIHYLTASSQRLADQTDSSHSSGLPDQIDPSNRAISSHMVEQTTSNQLIEHPNNRSRLVDAMQRLEQETSGHNNSVCKPSPFKHGSSVSLNDTNAAMDTSDCGIDPKADLKRRVSRKITDYFGKKTI